MPTLKLIVSINLIPWFSLASKSIRKRNAAKTSTSAAPAASPAPAARSASTPSGATGASAHQARHICSVLISAFFATFQNNAHISECCSQMAWLEFFLPSYAAAGIRSVSRVAPDWDL